MNNKYGHFSEILHKLVTIRLYILNFMLKCLFISFISHVYYSYIRENLFQRDILSEFNARRVCKVSTSHFHEHFYNRIHILLDNKRTPHRYCYN